MTQHDCPRCREQAAGLDAQAAARAICPCCRELERLVSEFVDGEVDAFRERTHCEKSQGELCEHLECCPDCRELACAEKEIRGLLVRCYQEHAPHELRLRIRESLTMVRATLPPT